MAIEIWVLCFTGIVFHKQWYPCVCRVDFAYIADTVRLQRGISNNDYHCGITEDCNLFNQDVNIKILQKRVSVIHMIILNGQNSFSINNIRMMPFGLKRKRRW